MICFRDPRPTPLAGPYRRLRTQRPARTRSVIRLLHPYGVRNDKIALFLHGTLRAGCALRTPARTWSVRRLLHPYGVRNDKIALFLHGTLRAGCALRRPARQSSVLAGSPDPARLVTFRSQRIRRPTVKFTRWSFQEAPH